LIGCLISNKLTLKKMHMKNNNQNLSWLKRLLSLTIMLAFIAPVMINAQTGKANFAGSWTFNAEKSTQPQGGGGGQRMGGDVVVAQEANLLTVTRTRTGQDGQPQTTVMKYTLDGKESINTSPRGDSKSVATWSADGKTLTVATSRTMDMNGETRTIKSSEAWVLTDAKTLTVTSTRQGQDGEVKTVLVYNKK
jgi:Tol biopolymer transport system component